MRPSCLDFRLQRTHHLPPRRGRAARGPIRLQPRTIPTVQGMPNAKHRRSGTMRWRLQGKPQQQLLQCYKKKKKKNMIFLKVSSQAPRPSSPVPAGNGSAEPLTRRQHNRVCPRSANGKARSIGFERSRVKRSQRLACRMRARLPRRQERSFTNTNTRRASAGRNAPGIAGYFKFRVYPVNAADKQIAGLGARRVRRAASEHGHSPYGKKGDKI